MITLYVIGGILVLFFLLLLTKVTVNISFLNDFQVMVKILIFKIKLYPIDEKEEKPIKLKEKKKVAKKQKDPKPKPPIKELLLLLKDLIIEIYSKFGKYIKIEECRIKVLVASDDPARTGVLYGVVCGILGSVSVYIDKIKRRSYKKGRIFTEVKPDFIAEEPELFVSVAFSMRVWQLMSIGITASKGFLKYNSLGKKA
ncbi:MAG: hypothetical protein A2Y15_01275 [Clostridiales bacterium GWF2_36_10]|nr:MAG: hypothetical protein A2Y15_01275 [Clostridiales bacterium GWF2_36_10]HAN22033.1 hypothetical protein [Clostridiales bacterium]